MIKNIKTKACVNIGDKEYKFDIAMDIEGEDMNDIETKFFNMRKKAYLAWSTDYKQFK